jgi:hypothetical protein
MLILSEGSVQLVIAAGRSVERPDQKKLIAAMRQCELRRIAGHTSAAWLPYSQTCGSLGPIDRPESKIGPWQRR